MAWVGPRRPNRSFNDDLIVVHLLPDDPYEHPKILKPYRIIASRALHMEPPGQQSFIALFHLRHHEQDPRRCRDLNRDDRIRRQVVK